MLELALYATGLGLIDSVNPVSIGFLIVLFPLLRRPIEGFWYVAGTFLTYLVVGFGLYLGLAISLKEVMTSIPMLAWVGSQLAVGLGLVALGSFLWSRQTVQKSGARPIRVGPLTLFLLGASNTIFDLPTSLPYIVLLGRLTAIGAEPVLAILILGAYNLVYIAPMLALQITYMIFRERIRPALDRLFLFLDRANRVLTIGLSILAGLVLTVDAVLRLPSLIEVA